MAPIFVILFLFFESLNATPPQRPHFEQATIEFYNKQKKIKSLNIELAQTPEQQQFGLMYIHKLKPNEGMLFDFGTESKRSFWMKNTFIPLSIGYFDAQGKLFEIIDMEPVKSELETPKSYPSSKPARYALEMNQGWFMKNGIKIDSQININNNKK